MEQQLEELDNYNSDNAGINMVPAVKMTVLLLVELQNEKVCALLPLCSQAKWTTSQKSGNYKCASS